jgi:hypothetical protein
MTVHEKVELMANKSLLRDLPEGASISGGGSVGLFKRPKMAEPIGLRGNSFMKEFHQIFYNQEKEQTSTSKVKAS